MRSVIIIGVLLCIAGAPQANACQCGASTSISVALAGSEQVFRARATATRTDRHEVGSGFLWEVNTISLRVAAVWKGRVLKWW
jgi:hypothetical protein